MTATQPGVLTIAANQGEVGGGEVMLIALAELVRELGWSVAVVAPAEPSAVADEAESRNFPTVRIPGRSTAQYLRNLRSWDRRHRPGLLWCNGLRPALATAGLPRRVVHLHQLPSPAQRVATSLARRAALATVVPSRYLQAAVPGSMVLANWTSPLPPHTHRPSSPLTIGFLGRWSVSKGLNDLLAAADILNAEHPGGIRLLLAGEKRFVPASEQAQLNQALASASSFVETPGWMDRHRFFKSVDIAVFPSRAPESFGLVAAEAMSARCPFVITTAGALPEIAGPDHPWVARAGDPTDLARVLRRCITTVAADESVPTVQNSYDRWSDNYSPAAARVAVSALLAGLEG